MTTPMLEIRATGDPESPTAIVGSFLVINPEYAQEVEDAFPDREMFLRIGDQEPLNAMQFVSEEERGKYIESAVATLIGRLGRNVLLAHMPKPSEESEDGNPEEGEVEQ